MNNNKITAAPAATDPVTAFREECRRTAATYKQKTDWQHMSNQWVHMAGINRYTYNFSFMGRPIIQFPQDMVAFQEIVWDVKPDLIIETGIAHGGSLIMSAAMLSMLDYCDAVTAGKTLDPKASGRKVIGIDIDIRVHNRHEIENHPMAHKIQLIQGSSTDEKVIEQVRTAAKSAKRVLVSLDSNHTHDHVLAELRAYAPMASKGSYCLVFDTVVEDMPDSLFPDRPWGKGNNPKTAVHQYLKEISAHPQIGIDGTPLSYAIDTEREDKLVLTVAPDGFLKRI